MLASQTLPPGTGVRPRTLSQIERHSGFSGSTVQPVPEELESLCQQHLRLALTPVRRNPVPEEVVASILSSEYCALAESSVSNIYILMLKWNYAYASFLSVSCAHSTDQTITDIATSWLRVMRRFVAPSKIGHCESCCGRPRADRLVVLRTMVLIAYPSRDQGSTQLLPSRRSRASALRRPGDSFSCTWNQEDCKRTSEYWLKDPRITPLDSGIPFLQSGWLHLV
jgi:hypothetical protein